MIKISYTKIFLLLATVAVFANLVSCNYTDPAKNSNSTLTAGEVKRQIAKGKTSQSEILSIFGSPNLVTKNKDNKEVWAYNKMSFDTSTGSEGGTLILFGGSKAVSSSATKSFDLIITFDNADIVEDYKMIQASY